MHSARALHAHGMRTACTHCMHTLHARCDRCEDQKLYEAAKADAELGGGPRPRAGEGPPADGRFVEAEQLNYVHRRQPPVHCAVSVVPRPAPRFVTPAS